MKKNILLLLLAMVGYNLYSQTKCNTEYISHRIDSICKVNKLSNCNVYFYGKGRSVLFDINQSNGKFRFDDCFLIVNEEQYYDLTKLINFNIRNSSKETEKRTLNIYFQN